MIYNKVDFAKKQEKIILDNKLKTEKSFKRDIKSYFFNQSKKVKAGKNIEPIESTLNNQYKRIVNNLLGVRLKQTDKLKKEYIDELELLMQGRALSQSEIIDKTTEKNLKDSEILARADFAEQGIDNPPPQKLAALTALYFRQKNKGRVENIAVTETQMFTEKARESITETSHKLLEPVIVDQDSKKAQEIADISQDLTSQKVADQIGLRSNAELFAILTLATKMWRDFGDNKVRPPHRKANGQEVLITEPFMVGGELLKYPGDTSLGASMWNIANCRCSAVYL